MKFNKQSGQALVGAAIAMVVLCGFAGLAIDMGTLRYQKRVEQTAADSAAIAGAQNLEFGSGWVAGAQNASTQNGFTDNSGGATCTANPNTIGCVSVTVNKGPATGPHAGDQKYIEVIVAEVQPTYFMQIFGVSSKSVTARAVATNVSGGTTSSCLYTLGPPTSAIIGINTTGNAKLIAPNCGISDNGNLDTTGNSYTVEASTVSVSGSCLGSHCGSPDVKCYASPGLICPPIGGAPASQDPMKGLAAPSMPAYSTSCPAVPPAGPCDYSSSSNSTATIQPGAYNSISIGKNSTVTMAPGIYYINGPVTTNAGTSGAGLNMGGGGTLTDMANPGVMLYFTGGSTMNKFVGGGNNPDLRLDPMTTAENATYAGILIFQDPADTTQAYIGGDNNTVLNGTVYMPTADLNYYGNTSFTMNGTVIAYSISITGNPTVTFGQSPSGVPIPALLTQPILVE
jgi:hypothetical protein